VGLGRHDIIAPDASALGSHRITLKDSITAAEFETFVANEWKAPDISGVTTYVIKGDRGNRNGSFALVYEMDQATRDRYFPSPGGLTAETQAMIERASSTAEQKRIGTRWQALVVTPPTPNDTDWVVISA
jgi:hypothetical protein